MSIVEINEISSVGDCSLHELTSPNLRLNRSTYTLFGELMLGPEMLTGNSQDSQCSSSDPYRRIH